MNGGELKEIHTLCDTSYLAKGLKNLEGATFCVGASFGGNPGAAWYAGCDLYACRLYTRCLSTTEIENNYHESVNYHNYLNNHFNK